MTRPWPAVKVPVISMSGSSSNCRVCSNETESTSVQSCCTATSSGSWKARSTTVVVVDVGAAEVSGATVDSGTGSVRLAGGALDGWASLMHAVATRATIRSKLQQRTNDFGTVANRSSARAV